VNKLKRHADGVAEMLQPTVRSWAGRRDAAVYRFAQSLFCVFALLTLSIGLAGPTRADCYPGYGTCPGLSGCYPLGSVCCQSGAYQAGAQCCQGGGACAGGSNCWGPPNHCCKAGSVGYKDGGCAPATIGDYCGNSNYCPVGETCVYNNGVAIGCRTTAASTGPSTPTPTPGSPSISAPPCGNPNGCSTITGGH
jgi:hypothetical protein